MATTRKTVKKKESSPTTAKSKTTSALHSALTKLKYRAVQSDKSRSPVYISSKSEDYELQQQDRQALISQSRQICRDFSLASWAVRQYIQFVSYYQFNANTDDDEFNAALEKQLKRWARKENCSVNRRFDFYEMLRLIETCRLVDGDVGILRVNDSETGGRLQIIESDRIRNSEEPHQPDENWVLGCRVNDSGRIIAYDVCNRKQYGGFAHSRFVSAKNMSLLGYYTRADQIRGISPLSGAIRNFMQISDCIDIALAKSRLENALGLAVTLNSGSALVEDEVDDTENRVEEIQKRATDVFGDGVFTFYGEEGEKVDMLTSNNPSANFQDFVEQTTRLVLLALDLPYNFLDSSVANFYGNKMAVYNWLDSVEQKQKPTIEWLNELTFDFLLPNFVLNGDIDLPSGYTIDDVRDECGWQGAYKPQYILNDSIKDVMAGITSGLLNINEVATEYGYNVQDNLNALADVLEKAKEKGITLPFGNNESQNIGL